MQNSSSTEKASDQLTQARLCQKLFTVKPVELGFFAELFSCNLLQRAMSLQQLDLALQL